MKIYIITTGSRGDVQPFVALGQGLQAAGHAVTICTHSRFEAFIRSYGLNYGYMTDELLQLMDTNEGREAMENTNGVIGAIQSAIKLTRQANPINRQMMLDSWEAAKPVKPDLILYHPKSLGAVHIAEKLDVPPVMVTLQLIMVPTAETPAIGFPSLNLGDWYNKLTYSFVHLGYSAYGGMINKFRKNTLDLPKFPRSAGVLQTADDRPIPVLHPISPYVLSQPTDWPDNAYMTGYWFLPQTADWQPSAELQAFLDEGESPIYIGFGSMSGRKPQRITKIVVEALQQAKVRGIIATGWGGLDAADLPDTILKINAAPHDWLFPRVAAVVHHGGAGTTAAGLRAGRPTIICPFFGDQPFWGKQVQAMGGGPEPIPQKKLTAEKLAAALRIVSSDSRMREKAAELGEQIRQEDGIANAITIIEELLPQDTKSVDNESVIIRANQ